MNVLVDMEVAASVCADHHFAVRGVILKHEIINVVEVNDPALIEIAISHGHVSMIILLCLGVLYLTKEFNSRTAICVWEAAIFNKEVVYGARLVPIGSVSRENNRLALIVELAVFDNRLITALQAHSSAEAAEFAILDQDIGMTREIFDNVVCNYSAIYLAVECKHKLVVFEIEVHVLNGVLALLLLRSATVDSDLVALSEYGALDLHRLTDKATGKLITVNTCDIKIVVMNINGIVKKALHIGVLEHEISLTVEEMDTVGVICNIVKTFHVSIK